MRHLSGLRLTVLLGTGLLLNACTKQVGAEMIKPNGLSTASFTNYVQNITVEKVNYSDSTTADEIGISAVNDVTPYIEGGNHFSPYTGGLDAGDTIIAKSANTFISNNNLPAIQTDSTDIFLMEDQERFLVIKNHRAVTANIAPQRIFKRLDNASTLTIKWRNNDVVSRHDPKKSLELANKTLSYLRDKLWRQGL